MSRPMRLWSRRSASSLMSVLSRRVEEQNPEVPLVVVLELVAVGLVGAEVLEHDVEVVLIDVAVVVQVAAVELQVDGLAGVDRLRVRARDGDPRDERGREPRASRRDMCAEN